ncbi:unnamed protein product [Polarella glacialis]|uniref:Uncharacterized protein n=1 Tax=Polarella glacialis TaxID=89957 RepID=A0A813G4N7_POLGL|nr:unnamed protein product [Polarella glacialis]
MTPAPVDKETLRRPLLVEALIEDGVFAVLRLPFDEGTPSTSTAAWIEDALSTGLGISVQRSGREVVATAPVAYVASKPPPTGTAIDRPWVALRAVSWASDALGSKAADSPPPLLVVGALGRLLSCAGVAWRVLPTAPSEEARVLVRRRDLPATAAALSRAGHVVTPSLGVCARPPPAPKELTQECAGMGAWRLVSREEPAGVLLENHTKSEAGALRLQSRSGLYVEVRLPWDDAGTKSQASSCGRSHAASHATFSDSASSSYSLVDFRPPRGGWQRHVSSRRVGPDGEMLEVAGLPPSRHVECWRRLGSAEDQVVALELVDDTRKRAGLWLFCGSRFARVVGPKGLGLVAGNCCRSLEHLMSLKGASAVEDDLKENYEAMEGAVEAPGELRVRRDSGSDRAGELLYSASDRAVGGTATLTSVEGQVKSLALHLPSGLHELWKVHEWGFDPFAIPKQTETDREGPGASEASSPKVMIRSKRPLRSASSSRSPRRSKRKLGSDSESPKKLSSELPDPVAPPSAASAQVAAKQSAANAASTAAEEAKASAFASAFAAAAAAMAHATSAPTAAVPGPAPESQEGSKDLAGGPSALRGSLSFGFGAKKPAQGPAARGPEAGEVSRQETKPPPPLPAFFQTAIAPASETASPAPAPPQPTDKEAEHVAQQLQLQQQQQQQQQLHQQLQDHLQQQEQQQQRQLQQQQQQDPQQQKQQQQQQPPFEQQSQPWRQPEQQQQHQQHHDLQQLHQLQQQLEAHQPQHAQQPQHLQQHGYHGGGPSALLGGSLLPPPPPPPAGGCGPSGGQEAVSEYCRRENVDPGAEQALRTLPLEAQQALMKEGPLAGSNRSAMLMSRIRGNRARVRESQGAQRPQGQGAGFGGAVPPPASFAAVPPPESQRGPPSQGSGSVAPPPSSGGACAGGLHPPPPPPPGFAGGAADPLPPWKSAPAAPPPR